MSLVSNSENLPTFPGYPSDYSSFILNLININNVSELRVGLLGLGSQGIFNTSSISVKIDQNNELVQYPSSTNFTGLFYLSNISYSDQISIIQISNWYINPSNQGQINNDTYYGIEVSTYDNRKYIKGRIILKPLITCNFPCRTCLNNFGECLDCYSLNSVNYLFWNNLCILDCNKDSSLFAYLN